MIDAVMPSVPEGLTSDEAGTLWRLSEQLRQKQPTNALLTAYYDGDRALQNLGISLPPKLRDVRAALGWPEKAVQALVQKHVFEGFTLDGAGDPFDLDELLERNRFELDLVQGMTSAYTHSCAFITTTHGDTESGEPDVVVQMRDAEWATALWDRRRREISAFLAVIDADDMNQPTALVFMLRGVTITLEKRLGRWRVNRRQTVPGRVLVEALTNDPQVRRPFGRSRITREVRYLTDAAVRTLVRSEVSAEFFASPQRYVLGADKDAFDSAAWTAVMGRVTALETNDEGEMPQVGQFPQISMEPHLNMYRQLAQNFAAATGLPQSSVGIFADNPASAEAMQAAESRLAETAEFQWRVFKPALVRTAQNVVMLRDRLVEPPAESWRLRVNSKPARYVSPQAAADFTVKAVGALPKIAETTEALRGLGYSDEQIEGMQAEWRRAGAHDRLTALVDAVKARKSDGVAGSGGAVPAEPVEPGGARES